MNFLWNIFTCAVHVLNFERDSVNRFKGLFTRVRSIILYEEPTRVHMGYESARLGEILHWARSDLSEVDECSAAMHAWRRNALGIRVLSQLTSEMNPKEVKWDHIMHMHNETKWIFIPRRWTAAGWTSPNNQFDAVTRKIEWTEILRICLFLFWTPALAYFKLPFFHHYRWD